MNRRLILNQNKMLLQGNYVKTILLPPRCNMSKATSHPNSLSHLQGRGPGPASAFFLCTQDNEFPPFESMRPRTKLLPLCRELHRLPLLSR